MENQMELVNIPKSVQDPFYRYKRHLPILDYSSKFGGLTTFKNVEQICSEIYTLPEDIIKYMKRGFGMSFKSTSPLSMKGGYTPEQVDEIIEKFIRQYVICKTCKNPETGDGVCKACGTKQR
jgi:translation initiation factor 5